MFNIPKKKKKLVAINIETNKNKAIGGNYTQSSIIKRNIF